MSNSVSPFDHCTLNVLSRLMLGEEVRHSEERAPLNTMSTPSASTKDDFDSLRGPTPATPEDAEQTFQRTKQEVRSASLHRTQHGLPCSAMCISYLCYVPCPCNRKVVMMCSSTDEDELVLYHESRGAHNALYMQHQTLPK